MSDDIKGPHRKEIVIQAHGQDIGTVERLRDFILRSGEVPETVTIEAAPNLKNREDLSALVPMDGMSALIVSGLLRNPLTQTEHALLLSLSDYLQTKLGISPVALLARACHAEEEFQEAPKTDPPIDGVAAHIENPKLGGVDPLFSPSVLSWLTASREYECRGESEMNGDGKPSLGNLSDLSPDQWRVFQLWRVAKNLDTLSRLAKAVEAPARRERKTSPTVAIARYDRFAADLLAALQAAIRGKLDPSFFKERGFPDSLLARIQAERGRHRLRGDASAPRNLAALILYELERFDEPSPHAATLDEKSPRFQAAKTRRTELRTKFPLKQETTPPAHPARNLPRRNKNRPRKTPHSRTARPREVH